MEEPDSFSENNEKRFDKISKTSKEAWEKGKDRLREVGETVHKSLEDQGNARFYSALAYLPVFGPIITWLFKRNQSLTRLHTIHAFYLQLTFLVIGFAVWLLLNLPIISGLLDVIRFNTNVTPALMWCNVAGLIIISGYSALKANQGERWVTPWFFDFMNKYFRFYEGDNARLPAGSENT